MVPQGKKARWRECASCATCATGQRCDRDQRVTHTTAPQEASKQAGRRGRQRGIQAWNGPPSLGREISAATVRIQQIEKPEVQPEPALPCLRVARAFSWVQSVLIESGIREPKVAERRSRDELEGEQGRKESERARARKEG